MTILEESQREQCEAKIQRATEHYYREMDRLEREHNERLRRIDRVSNACQWLEDTMKVYELLATPDKWTQHMAARNANGLPVNASDDKAVCWCLRGAQFKCYSGYEALAVEERLIRRFGAIDSAVAWNDAPERAHAEVLALCKELDI